MKPSLIHSILCGALLAAGPLSAWSADKKSRDRTAPLSREESVLLTITASVEAIDPAKREVTLKGPLGNKVTLTVDPRVKRLKEVKVGDLVQADYYVSIAAELRKPTPEEEKSPIMALEGTAKAPPDTAPAAGGLRRFKVVTTIEGLDRPTQTITVQGPLGNQVTARVSDPSILTQLRIGENVVIVFTEALAISLEKAEKKSKD